MIEQTDDWPVIRRQALQRDQNRCRYCKKDADELMADSDTGLHVHHIRPREEFESLDEANRLSNLITLCPSCHRRWEELGLRMETPPADDVECGLGDKTQAVLEIMKDEWRANPGLIRERTELSRQEVGERLKRLIAMDLVEKVCRGLYEYVDDDGQARTQRRRN